MGAMNRSSLKGRAFWGGPLSMLQGKTSVRKTMYSFPGHKRSNSSHLRLRLMTRYLLPCPSLSFHFFPFPSLFFLAVPCCSFFLPCSFLSSLVLQIWPPLVAVRFPAHNQHQPANKHNAKLNDNEKNSQMVYIFLGNGTSTAGAKAMNVSTKSYHICILYIILYSLLLLLLSFASPPYSYSSCLLISATLLNLSYSTTLPSRN